MKESVLDVLMYLFETYMEEEDQPEPDRDILRSELASAGFSGGQIDRALDWLDGLARGEERNETRAPAARSIRVFNRHEISRLDSSCRGYVMYLEQIGILSAAQRELVIDRLMALDNDEIDVEQIKWVVLIVLFSHPGQEAAYARMEDLDFEEDTGLVH